MQSILGNVDVKCNEIEKTIKDCNPTEIYIQFEQILTSTASEIVGKYRSKITAMDYS